MFNYPCPNHTVLGNTRTTETWHWPRNALQVRCWIHCLEPESAHGIVIPATHTIIYTMRFASYPSISSRTPIQPTAKSSNTPGTRRAHSQAFRPTASEPSGCKDARLFRGAGTQAPRALGLHRCPSLDVRPLSAPSGSQPISALRASTLVNLTTASNSAVRCPSNLNSMQTLPIMCMI